MGSTESRRCTINWNELQLPTVEAEGLDAPFTEAEVWAAVLASPAEKAPGPDGFNRQFFHSCWDLIKDEVMAIFHQFHSLSGANFALINSAFVALLPKKDGAESVGFFLAYQPDQFNGKTHHQSVVHAVSREDWIDHFAGT